MDADEFFRDLVDYAGPKLDTYELAIYLFVIRHSRFKDLDEIVVPVQSASIRVAIGIAKKGARISRDVFRKKLQSLEAKGFLRILGKEYSGTRIRPLLPREVPGTVVLLAAVPQIDLESMDFFSDTENREAIFAREGRKCFYCLVSLNDRNRVIDHVVPRAERDNSYRNCVGACLNCNSEKGDSVGDDFLRTLYRRGRLRAEELDSRLQTAVSDPRRLREAGIHERNRRWGTTGLTERCNRGAARCGRRCKFEIFPQQIEICAVPRGRCPQPASPLTPRR